MKDAVKKVRGGCTLWWALREGAASGCSADVQKRSVASSSLSCALALRTQVIAALTVGKDMSPLFPDVVNCMQTGALGNAAPVAWRLFLDSPF
jgi:hypothetical protein